MTLPVGTVLKYNDYPHGDDGIVKPYWFVVMGRTSLLHQPQYYFFFKTTTQYKYYKTGGERINSHHKLLTCDVYTCFERDCYLDFDLPVFDRHTIEEVETLISSGKIEIKGRLEKILIELYHLSIKGTGAPFKVKELFHSSFNTDGLTGLNKPQQRNKDYYRKKFSR